MEFSEEQQALTGFAAAVRGNAYSRYSGLAVGSAVRTLGGSLYTGCNVENSSLGLAVCAERNAIAAAVAGGMQPGGLAAIAVVGGKGKPATPCGACRQVIAEFAAPGCEVICSTPDGTHRVFRLDELLPEQFSLEQQSPPDI